MTAPSQLQAFDPRHFTAPEIANILAHPAASLHGLAMAHAGSFGPPDDALWERLWRQFWTGFHPARCCVTGERIEDLGNGNFKIVECEPSLGRRFEDGLAKPHATEAAARTIIDDLTKFGILGGCHTPTDPTPRYRREPPPSRIRERAVELARIGDSIAHISPAADKESERAERALQVRDGNSAVPPLQDLLVAYKSPQGHIEILKVLAKNPGRRLQTKQIAQDVGRQPNSIGKDLTALKEAKLIDHVRGKGYAITATGLAWLAQHSPQKPGSASG